MASGRTSKRQVQLNRVDPGFTNYLFSATVAITLLGPGMQYSPWQIQFEPGQIPRLVQATPRRWRVQANQYTINMAAATVGRLTGCRPSTTTRCRSATSPTEAQLPVPTHFAIQMPDGSSPIVCLISQWALDRPQHGRTIPDGSTLFVTFFLRTTTNDLQLSIAGLPVASRYELISRVVCPPPLHGEAGWTACCLVHRER